MPRIELAYFLDKAIRVFLAALLVVIGGVLPRPGLADPGCLRYMPERVSLQGILKRMTFPGPPGYRSIAAGDARETDYYLLLSTPLCLDGDEKDETAYPQKDVKSIQLSLDAPGTARLKPLLGQPVTLSGALFAAHTLHHHAAAVLSEVRLETPSHGVR